MGDPGYDWNAERVCFEVREAPGAPVQAVVWRPKPDFPATSEEGMARRYPGALLVPAPDANVDRLIELAQEYTRIARQEAP